MERFIQHILPSGFTRIRHYGFLSPRCKTEALKIIREDLKVDQVPAVKRSKKEVLEEKWGSKSLLHCKHSA